jgi:hypothetical protein
MINRPINLNENRGCLIPTKVHGILDYLVGSLLMMSPWLFGFADHTAGMWVPIVLGVSALAYSIFTDYELGAIRRLPMRMHLLLDMGSGMLLAASPWLFGFADRVNSPHVIFGVMEIVVAAWTQRASTTQGRGHTFAHA